MFAHVDASWGSLYVSVLIFALGGLIGFIVSCYMMIGYLRKHIIRTFNFAGKTGVQMMDGKDFADVKEALAYAVGELPQIYDTETNDQAFKVWEKLLKVMTRFLKTIRYRLFTRRLVIQHHGSTSTIFTSRGFRRKTRRFTVTMSKENLPRGQCIDCGLQQLMIPACRNCGGPLRVERGNKNRKAHKKLLAQERTDDHFGAMRKRKKLKNG